MEGQAVGQVQVDIEPKDVVLDAEYRIIEGRYFTQVL
jgi:hypothetical protein